MPRAEPFSPIKGRRLSRRDGEPACRVSLWYGCRRHSRPRHGTDHDSKSQPSFPGFCLPARLTSVPTRRASKWLCDREKVRPQSARAAICRRPATTNSPNGALISSPVGVSRLPSVHYAARRLSPLRRCGCRRSSLGRRQTHTDQSIHALPSPLGAAIVMERDGGGISHILGQGFRRGRTCRHLGSETPDARPDRRHRRR